MSDLFRSDVLAGLLKEHGLANKDVVTGVATALAESNLLADAVNVNDDGSKDRGIWQLNDGRHSEVSDEEAFDPVKATVHAVRIRGDGDWTAWNAYKNGAWRVHERTGWLSLRLHNCISARSANAEELAAATDANSILRDDNTRLIAAIPALQERINILDGARHSALEILKSADA